MGTNPVNKLEALAVVVGPALALVFFLIEPGGMLIDSVESTDYVGKINALASNAALSHAAALGIPLGLLVTLYGLAGVNRAIPQDDTTAAVIRFGFLSLTIGGIGWIMATGLTHVIAETQLESQQALQSAVPLQQTDAGITIISGMAVSLGLAAFSLGLSTKDPLGFHKIAALVVFAVSLISLVALIIGHSAPSEDMVRLGRLCYFPWVIWNVILGARFLKGNAFARAP